RVLDRHVDVEPRRRPIPPLEEPAEDVVDLETARGAACGDVRRDDEKRLVDLDELAEVEALLRPGLRPLVDPPPEAVVAAVGPGIDEPWGAVDLGVGADQRTQPVLLALRIGREHLVRALDVRIRHATFQYEPGAWRR